MATISRTLSMLLGATLLLASPTGAPAQASDSGALRATRPVAYYDVDAVLRGARALAPERARLSAIIARYEAELDPLQAQVHALRDQVASGAVLPVAERRALESRLADSTIELIMLRAEGVQEVAAERALLIDRVAGRVVPAVSRAASAQGLAVVVRTDRGTTVLDEDAIDLTPAVIATLDASAPDEAPGLAPPSGHDPSRLQACGAPDVDGSPSGFCPDAGN